MGKKISAKTPIGRMGSPYFNNESGWNDKVYLQEIGKGIKNMREDRNISQAELARITGMKVPNISVIECGKSNPQLLTILRLVGAMRGNLIDIFPIPDDLSFILSSPKMYKPRKHLLKKK